MKKKYRKKPIVIEAMERVKTAPPCWIRYPKMSKSDLFGRGLDNEQMDLIVKAVNEYENSTQRDYAKGFLEGRASLMPLVRNLLEACKKGWETGGGCDPTIYKKSIDKAQKELGE